MNEQDNAFEGGVKQIVNEPVRVLCVFACLDRGGAEMMCMNLYRHVDRKKVQFDFVKHTENIGAFEKEILKCGGRIYEAPRFKGYNYLQYRKWWREHLRSHPEHRIVHGHFFTISTIYFGFAKRQRRVTVGHSHSSSPPKKSIKGILEKLLQGGIEARTNHCLACSRAAGEWLFPHREFTIINNAIDIDRFRYNPLVREEIKKEFGIGDELIVGIVGSLSPVKNPHGAIAIFKEILKRKSTAKLLWVGDGAMREEIERKLEEEGLINSVIMTGVREDVCQIIQAMDVFIFPSVREGLGIAAIEAQAAGLPCFISDTVPREVAITELCTFLPNDKPEQWADAILAIDVSERKETSEQIKKAGYDIEDVSKQMEEFYLSLLT